MDEVLLKQLIRQVRWLNIWITVFGVLFIVTFVIMGFLVFKAVSYIHQGQQSITNFQKSTSQSLDVKQQLCKSDFKSILGQSSTYCQ